MIFIAKNADFSAKNIGKVSYAYDDNEAEDDVTTLIYKVEIRKEGVLFTDGSTHAIGERLQLHGVAYPTNAYLRNDLSWSSSDTSKATVSDNGMVTFIRDGSVAITVMAKDGSYSKSTVNINIRKRTISDKLPITDTVIRYYYPNGTHPYTKSQVVALDTLLARLGAGADERDNVWNKTMYLMLPCLGSSVDNAATNVKNGYDPFESRASNATKYKSSLNFSNGYFTPKTPSSAYIPTAFESGKVFTIKNGYYMLHSGIHSITGSTTSWQKPMYMFRAGQRAGIDSVAGTTYYAEISKTIGVIRGCSTDLTYDGTHIAPSELITNTYDNTFEGLVDYINSATWHLENILLYLYEHSSFTYFYAYGKPLTKEELENTIYSLNEFFAAFGVDTKINS